MSKKISISFFILILGISSWMVQDTFKVLAMKKKVLRNLKELPSFEYYDTDSTLISLQQKTPTAIIYFNTDCDHCQYEATEIERNILKFKNAQLLMLSIEPLKNIKSFITTYRLENLENLRVGQISGKTAVETFGFKSVPHILIYNAENQLVKDFKGETKIEAILKYL